MLGLPLAIFAVDVRLPIGVTFWQLHLIPIGLAMFAWRSAVPLLVAALVSVLVVLDFFWSPAGGSPEMSQFNRAVGLVVFWSFAGFGRLHIRGKQALSREEWIRERQAELATQVQGELTVEQVASRALELLVRTLGCAIGAAWVVDEGGALRRVAGHALPADAAQRLASGEGLVGQTAQDGRLRSLVDVPADYLVIGSSVGQRAPLHLLLWPLKAEGEVFGVIELGLLRRADEQGEALLERTTESLAIALRSARYRARLLDALEETQQQSEELQAQQEELRVVNEELEQQGSALRETQRQQERAQIELEETNANLEEQTSTLEQQRDDLTRAQRELMATAADLTKASQYKSEFLANMSHELRTPLNSSLILAKLLADNPGGNLSDEQVKFAETIYSAGNDLLGLINDILDLARIEAGHLSLHVVHVPLAKIRESLIRTFEPVSRNKGLGFTVELVPGAPPTIETDEGRLQQVLRNLVANALKFTERGAVTVRIERDGEQLRFAVRDTGIGIPAEQHALIFEAFRQADGTTSRKYGGSGLGLSISRDLARLLGGDLGVTSQPGQGSVFTLTLPLTGGVAETPPQQTTTLSASPSPASPPQALLPPSRPALPVPPRSPTKPAADERARKPSPVADDRDRLDRQRRTLLVVEDDPSFAEILIKLAHELDFQCLVTDSAEEAVRLATQHQPSGVLLDIGLPDHSGMSVLEQLKRKPATRHIPVHVISAEDFTQRAMEMGAVGYLRKPSAREDLIAAIGRIQSRLVRQVHRVLIIEDDPVHRDSLRHLLGGEHIEIVTAATVAEALEQLRSNTFDCAVTDLILGDGTGFDLLERMATDDNLSFPPVIVHTGRSLSESEEQRLRKYSSSIIIKGARSPERLLDEVTLFLHQVEADLPAERQRMLRGVRDREAAFEGRTVLIVEDDVRNVFALTSILEPKGVHVLIARNGLEGLEQLAKAERIDLVLMDVMMPEMDGLEATRRLRTDPRWARLPVLALTAKAMQDDRERCLAAGASDYLAKPINVEMLLSLMRVWMPRG